ncbi:MAG: HEPN domain-containing protein [Kofleriaceae bacterium]
MEQARIALDRMEQAHRAFGGASRGRRYATQQLNQSYLVMLSSHFQQFCRDLHSEAVDHLLRGLDPTLRPIVQSVLASDRKLDRGNPTPGNLGSDFGRLGMRFWPDVSAVDAHNAQRTKELELMGHWRNAIAHQDFAGQATRLGGRTEITLQDVRRFRGVCNGLARGFDSAVLAHIKAIAGPTSGW